MKYRRQLFFTISTIINTLQRSTQANTGPDVVCRGLIDAPALHYTRGDGPQVAIRTKRLEPIKAKPVLGCEYAVLRLD